MKKSHLLSLILSFCFILSLFTATAEAKDTASIHLNKTNATIYTTASVTLKSTTNNITANISWSSSNPKIAKVNSKGKVTGVKPGTCTITAFADGVKAKCKITVKKVTSSYLKKKLGKSVGGTDMIKDFCSADYDGDGVLEAFAVVGTEDEYSASGSIYFVSASKIQTMLENAKFWIYKKPLLDFKKAKYYTIGKAIRTVDLTYIFGVKNGKPFEDPYSLQCSELRQIGTSNQLKVIHTALDWAYSPSLGYCSGQTFKSYDVYWDGSFHEYGGIKITKKQFLKCTGAKKILSDINAVSDGISDIIYRGNNTININYYKKDTDGYCEYSNATLKLSNKKVSYIKAEQPFSTNTALESSDQGGTYLTAVNPEFAVYPSKFPVK